jgi:hypothetical protein
MATTNTRVTTEELLKLCVSVLRLYDEGQLPLELSLETAVRRAGGWCEMAASLGGSQWSGVSWLVS